LAATLDLFVMILTFFLEFPPQEHFFSDKKEGLLAAPMLKECREGRRGGMEEKRAVAEDGTKQMNPSWHHW